MLLRVVRAGVAAAPQALGFGARFAAGDGLIAPVFQEAVGQEDALGLGAVGVVPDEQGAGGLGDDHAERVARRVPRPVGRQAARRERRGGGKQKLGQQRIGAVGVRDIGEGDGDAARLPLGQFGEEGVIGGRPLLPVFGPYSGR